MSSDRLDLDPHAGEKCPGCAAQRMHTPEELSYWHPLAGHGFTPETGYTHPQIKADHEAAKEKKVEQK